MIEVEFAVPSRLEDLFSSSSKNYTVNDVLSKQSVTVEVMQFKRSMYEDLEGFIFTNFDAYCCLLKHFKELDASLKISSMRVLLQVADKIHKVLGEVTSEDTDEFEREISFKYRNMVMMLVYLLCQMTQSFEDEIKRNATAKSGKNRKAPTSHDDELSEWYEERLKFLVIMKKIFQLPIRKFWSPQIIDYEFVNYVTNAFFKLLENVAIARDKGMRKEIFRFLGAVLAENRTVIGYSIKILQMVQDFDHLPNIMAEGVILFMQEYSADTLASDICREVVLLDMKALQQNLNSAHSLESFLIAVSEHCPEKILHMIGSLLEFLEMESHIMRNCVLSIIGILLSKVLSSENVSEKDLKLRDELMDHLETHLLDVSSFVRSKAIQIFKSLLEEKALASNELPAIGKSISKHIKDTASNVRKAAMSFMIQFIEMNYLSCQVPIEVLRESYQKECDKLNEMKKSRPIVFEESDVEDSSAPKNAVIFDDSDSEEEREERGEEEPTAAGAENAGAPNDGGCNDEEWANQNQLVAFVKRTLDLAEVACGASEPVSQLLRSETQTDVLEAVEFFASTARLLPGGPGARRVLDLVWAEQAAVREAALRAFRSVHLGGEGGRVGSSSTVAKKLMQLLKDATKDDEKNLEAFVVHFCKSGEIAESVSEVVWGILATPAGISEEEKVSALILLGMIAEECPNFVMAQFDLIMQYGLGPNGQKNFQLAKHTLRTLNKANAKRRLVRTISSVNDSELRLSSEHDVVVALKRLLIQGITNFEDTEWTPMADDAVALIFSMTAKPIALCQDIVSDISLLLKNEIEYTTDEGEDRCGELPSLLQARFLSLCGHVALHYLVYLKVDYFAHLRRQEKEREQRRRKSVMATPPAHSISRRNTPKSTNRKKRQSIHRQYTLVPPMDEETMIEQIIQMRAREIKSDQHLIGKLLPLVVSACRHSLKNHRREVQAAASLALAKFMLFSEEVCEEHMQLFATLAEKSPEPHVRANLVLSMGDLVRSYPNVAEPWTGRVFQRLNDSDAHVRATTIITLFHLILHDFVRVKSLTSEAAKCIADEDETVANVAKSLFTELSKKGNVIYNIIPDIISSLSDPERNFSEEKFQVVLSHILQYVEKEKLIEGLVEKLIMRFVDASSTVQMHELTFCLSILTLNDRCYRKLTEFKSQLKERMSDPVISQYLNDILANAKKNDAKTAAELRTFRAELDI